MRKYTVIGLSTLIVASSALAVATNTFQIGGQGADNGWDDNVVTNTVGTTNYSITFGTPDRYGETAISNLTFTVTFAETNGIPCGAGQNWLYPTIDGGVDDRRLNSNEVIRLTVSYSDPNAKLTNLRLNGVAPYFNTNPWETTVFSDGVNSTNLTDTANEVIFNYEALGLEPLTTNNVATWELLVAVDDTSGIGGGTNFTESGMGAFVLEYVADVDFIPDTPNLTPAFFDFVDTGGLSGFDNAGVGATMTRSNSWDTPITITTVEIIGQDGSSATNGTDNKTNIQSVNALGVNSAANIWGVGSESRDFNPGEAWVVSFDKDVYMVEIDMASVSVDTEMTMSSSAFPDFVMYGQGDDNTGGTWDLMDMYVPAGTAVRFEMTSTTNSSTDWQLRIDDLTLQVVADAESYTAWAQDEGLVETINDAYGDDPDLDDMDNLLEFALGGNPLTNDAAALLPVYELTDEGGTSWLNYIYRRRVKYDFAGLTYAVGSSGELTSALTNVTAEAGSASIDTDIESVTNRMSTEVEAQQFLQLNVTID